MKYIYDTFTDPNGTLFAAHVPDINRPGGLWAAIAGAWTIQGNHGETTNVANARAVIDTDLADGRFKVDAIIGGATDAAYLIFRSNAAGTNFWMAGLDDTLQQVVLQSSTAMALTSRAARAFVIDETTAYEIKVCCRGDEIEVYINDVLLISHVSALYNTQQYAGLYATANPDADFDDFVADERPTCLYCTTTDVKSRVGTQWTSGTTYDDMLEDAIEEASRIIDEEKGWNPCHFAASDQATSVRYYDGLGETEQQIDRFLDDVAFAVAVDDDADGVYTAWIRNTDYVTWPYNEDYINRLVLTPNSTVSFTPYQKSLEVTGRLGAYDEPPAQVKKATAIMVAKAFKRGLQMYQDTGAVVELGQLTYTLAIDPEVERILKHIPGRAYIG